MFKSFFNKLDNIVASPLEKFTDKLDEFNSKEKNKHLLSNYSPSNGNSLKYTILSVQTANKKKYNICQVGVYVKENNEIRVCDDFLIKPSTKTFSFSDYHGITYDMVKDEPTFLEVWSLLKSVIENNFVITYSNFSIESLINTLEYYKIPVPSFNHIELLDICQSLYPKLDNHKLHTIADELNLSYIEGDSLNNVKLCAEILTKIEETKPKRFSSIFKVRK